MELQPASFDIWDKKYRLRAKDGTAIDNSIDDTFKRVARALADVEILEKRDEWYEKFLWALNNGALPAGRIISNAGAWEYKPSTSTINCTVSGDIQDSMDDILAKVHEAGLTLKSGCGIGYCFSTLRPKGAYVSGSGAYTSGPLSFMDIYDKMCFTVSSAGGRRGAQMATFHVSHPDIIDFVKAKREDGRLRQFNLSVLITNAFMYAVINDENWDLTFNNKVYRTIKARELWDLIMRSNYDYAEPGIIFIDRVNNFNNNWWCENITTSNPCSEQPLPPYGSCLLGSIDLTKFVNYPFTDKVSFDWDKYRKVVAIFTRMLDNVVEINGLPLAKQREELINKRRHGMGYLGLGSALTLMRIKYGSPESIQFTDQVTRELALVGWQVGVDLAKEKGAAPIMENAFKRPDISWIETHPYLDVHGMITGRQLLTYSDYMRNIQQIAPSLVENIGDIGCRFTHHTSIAPTGTISLSLANNASNGIEPSFAHHYSRNIIREGKKSKEKVDVYSYEFLLYRELVDKNATVDNLPDYFVDANSISPHDHIAIQAAAQKWVDSAISKTINVPTDYPFEQFKDIYLHAYQSGLKGCTTFRFNPEALQGVLVKNKDLENTQYQFTLADGTTITAKGNENIKYDGEIHSAANLFDALKEGYYGKF